MTGPAGDDLGRTLGGGRQALGDPEGVQDPPAGPDARRGDLWLPGRHRLVCGGDTLRVRRSLVWVKPALTFGRTDYYSRHEPRLYGRRGARGTGGSEVARPAVPGAARPARAGDHPTPGPVSLFEALVRNSRPAGGAVLDPPAGSGNALAAGVAGRGAALVGLDPRSSDPVVRGYERLTDKTAEQLPAAAAQPRTLRNPVKPDQTPPPGPARTPAGRPPKGDAAPR